MKVVLPEALGVEEVEYRSVLVPFEDDAPFSEETLGTAVRLASKRRRGIHVVSVLTVPTHLPLDAPLQRPGARGAAEDRAGEADRRPAGERPRPPGAAQSGRALDRGGGRGDEGERDRDRAALPQRGAALRQDAPDSPRRAALPRDRRRRAIVARGPPPASTTRAARPWERRRHDGTPTAVTERGLPARDSRIFAVMIIGFGIAIVVDHARAGRRAAVDRLPVRPALHGARRGPPLPEPSER